MTAQSAAMIGAVVSLTVLAGLVAYCRLQAFRSSRRASTPAGGEWPQHPAIVIGGASVAKHGRAWHVSVRYRYTVAGEQYEGDTIRGHCGPDGELVGRSNAFSTRDAAELFTSGHTAGASTVVHVSPYDPLQAVLRCDDERPVRAARQVPERVASTIVHVCVIVLGVSVGLLAALSTGGG